MQHAKGSCCECWEQRAGASRTAHQLRRPLAASCCEGCWYQPLIVLSCTGLGCPAGRSRQQLLEGMRSLLWRLLGGRVLGTKSMVLLGLLKAG